MGIEQLHHLELLYQTHEKRLRMLELKEAAKGQDTPAEILMEIGELREKLCALQKEIATTRAALTQTDRIPHHVNGQVMDTATEVTKKVELVFEGDFDHLTPERRHALVLTIAALVGITPEQVLIDRIEKGSIILEVELPEEAADRLLALYESQDARIQESGIVSVREIVSAREPFIPPKTATRLLYYLPKQHREDVIGDLAEDFQEVCEQFGYRKAAKWYWWQVLTCFPVYFKSGVFKLVDRVKRRIVG